MWLPVLWPMAKPAFSFKSNEVVFGGGRLRVAAKDLPLDVDALFAVYDEANKNAANGVSENKSQTESTERAGRSRRKAGKRPSPRQRSRRKSRRKSRNGLSL